MFCMKCGAELSPDTKFCQTCGTPVEGQAAPAAEAQTPVTPAPQAAPAPEKKPKKPMSKAAKGIIAGAAALVVILAVVLTLVLTAPKKVSLSEYIDVSFYGYDSYGDASVSLDQWSLYSDLVGGKDDSAERLDDLWSQAEKYSGLSDLISSITWDVEPSENLSNGDVVTITMSYDEELAKAQKIKLTDDTLEVTVEDLDKITVINPFDDVSVAFDGISPNGTAQVDYEGDYSEVGYSMEVSQRSGLKNGDTITVTFYAENLEPNYGIRLSETEKTYEVSGLAEYITDLNEISEADLDAMKQETEDVIYAYTAGNYSSSSSISDLQYAGYILLSSKSADYYDYNNYLYLIYKAALSNSNGDFYKTDIYYPVRFSQLVAADGSLSYDDWGDIQGYSDMDGGGWGYSSRGYRNPYVCYQDLAEANRDNYTIQCGGGFENFQSNTPIQALTDIPEQTRTQLQEEAKTYVETYITNDYSDDYQTSGVSLAGEYLLVAKSQGGDYEQNNRYYVVFTTTVSKPEDEDFEPVTVYYPVGFYGLVNMPDSGYQITAHNGISGSSKLSGYWDTTAGYLDGADMYTKLITANRDLYTYEVSEGLKQFGE